MHGLISDSGDKRGHDEDKDGDSASGRARFRCEAADNNNVGRVEEADSACSERVRLADL